MTRALGILAFTFAATAAVAGTQAPTGSAFGSPLVQSRLTSPLAASKQAIEPPAPSMGPVTPVPEPSTWAMLVLGGLALFAFELRRRPNRDLE